MQDIPTKITGDSLTAAEFNQIPDELENLIESTGQTLSGADLFQGAKAVADYAGGGDFYTDSGAADAYVLGVIGSKQGPTAYANGLRVRFIVGNTNTGASTVNVNGLGVKNIKTRAGADPAAGALTAGDLVVLEYDGTNFVITSTPIGVAVITQSYVSTGQTITAAGLLTLAHGFGVVPKLVQLRIKCTTADNEYAVGDEVIINPAGNDPGATANRGVGMWVDATNINIRYGSDANTISIIRKTTGAANPITNTSWELYVYAWA